MNTTVKPSNIELQDQREIIRRSLDEIATDLGTALRNDDLNYPVFLTIPCTGDAIATFATPLDPSDDDWKRVSVIVKRIMSERLAGAALGTRERPCAMANATMRAADVTVD